MIKRKLHWSAVVGVGCSFWLLFWLFCLATSLYDIYDGNDISSQISFMSIVGVFLLWAAYQSTRRLDLLRNGEFRLATINKETSEGYDYTTGATSKVTLTNYRYLIDNQSYTDTLWWSFGLKKKKSVEIVYHTRKPGYSRIASRLRARFDKSANQWRSSMWHVVPRLTLLIVILCGIISMLFSAILL